jgi:hypothetical protein
VSSGASNPPFVKLAPDAIKLANANKAVAVKAVEGRSFIEVIRTSRYKAS